MLVEFFIVLNMVVLKSLSGSTDSVKLRQKINKVMVI